jgi:hypothetical protein
MCRGRPRNRANDQRCFDLSPALATCSSVFATAHGECWGCWRVAPFSALPPCASQNADGVGSGPGTISTTVRHNLGRIGDWLSQSTVRGGLVASLKTQWLPSHPPALGSLSPFTSKVITLILEGITFTHPQKVFRLNHLDTVPVID